MSEKKRVAFAIESICDGGLERRTVNLVNELSKSNNIDVCLISGTKKNNEYPLQNSVRRIQIMSGCLLKDVYRIRMFMCKNDIDVVVGMGIYSNFVVSLIRFLCNKKVVIVEANDPRHDNISKESKILRKLTYWRADGYVFQTREEQEYYSKNIQRKPIVIPNPVLEELPSREEPIIPEIVATGRMEKQKNYEMLIDAFNIVHKKHPNYKLKIYGKGSECEKIQAKISELDLNKYVEMPGFTLNVHKKIQHSDIYVLSSLFEGMPNALMEAMAMGFPVVSTDCGGGGPRELIQDNVNGRLTLNGSSYDLADKLCELIENPVKKEMLGKNAKAIRGTHCIENISLQWIAYLNRIIGC